MPDLKSQLEEVKHKLANMAFDDEGEAVQEQPEARGRNISRTLWLHVKDNPGSTSSSVNKATGVDTTSTSSLLSQMYTKGVMTRTKPADGGPFRYTVVDPNYKPLTSREALALAVAAKAKAKVKVKVKPKAKAKPAPAAPHDIDVQALLDNMSITKARALYDALKKIFGA